MSGKRKIKNGLEAQKMRVSSSSLFPKIPVSSTIRFVDCTCPWILYLLALSHKTVNGGPSSRTLRPSSTPVRVLANAVCAAFYASLLISIASTCAEKQEEKVKRREQQMLFEDIVTDAFPADLEQ